MQISTAVIKIEENSTLLQDNIVSISDCDQLNIAGEVYYQITAEFGADIIKEFVGDMQPYPHFFFYDSVTNTKHYLSGKIDISEDDFKKLPDYVTCFYSQSFFEELSDEWEGFSKKTLYVPLMHVQSSDNHTRVIIRSKNKDELKIRVFPKEKIEQFELMQKEIKQSGFLESQLRELITGLNRSDTNLKKVVFSSHDSFEGINDLREELLFDFLCNGTKSNMFSYFFSPKKNVSFFGISPEVFLNVNDKKIQIDALAGTAKIEDNEVLTERELLNSSKDRIEHQYVIDHIVDVLESLGLAPFLEKEFHVKTAGHLKHLHSVITAKWENSNKIFDLIKGLHPTPALGGLPVASAIEYIKGHESYDRGLYGSPIGLISRKSSLLVVAIRSALQRQRSVKFFAGAGIVADSIVESELAEISQKFRSLQEVLCPSRT